jgi:glycosyltransferase involved in cell wall biosynthesis
VIGPSSPTIRSLRICMGVWGSLRHDARVARSAGSLARAGVSVTVVAASWRDEELGRRRHPLGFEAVTVRRRPPRGLEAGAAGAGPIRLAGWLVQSVPAYWRFMRELWRTSADVYHAHDLQALPWVWLVARLRRRPVVYDAHEISADRSGFRRIGRIVAAVEGALARRSAAMITTTDMRADYFARAYGVPRPIVLQNRPHYAEPPRTRRLHDALGLPADAVVVLYQGGLQPHRGLFTLLDVVPDVPSAHFVFLGDGPLRSKLEARVRQRGLLTRVHFLPAVPWHELAVWTAAADVGVQLIENTSLNHFTTDSNKLFEYVMAGLPVVASNFPEIRRIVTAYRLGELVDPADRSSIAAALRRLTTGEHLREQYRQNALAARRDLSWETQESELLALYERIAPKRTTSSVGAP